MGMVYLVLSKVELVRPIKFLQFLPGLFAKNCEKWWSSFKIQKKVLLIDYGSNGNIVPLLMI